AFPRALKRRGSQPSRNPLVGISPETLATALLEQHFSQVLPVFTDVQKELAQAKFERHFGTLNIHNSTNIDNESIDADLTS
ncbi:hypothetical protein MEN41_09300, partial [Dolichospermum sp. ST_con]|nr:hypothetical protein [Dolichospermum sp. ST_con]MDD1455556.1 hypothetical protein [Dolichospermum sp. ST_sed7]